jgi:hypothetical protein
MASQTLPRTNIGFEQSFIHNHWTNPVSFGNDLGGVQRTL